MKYTPDGSVRLTVSRKDGEWLIQVADTGPGFTDSQRQQLFQSYQMINDTNREGVQGTGLGLVFVKELVAMHQGHIELESQVGCGSTFSVYLPLTTTPRVD